MSTGNDTVPVLDPSTLLHESRRPNLIACAILTWLASGAFVGLRFYTRRILIKALHLSDWFILASWVVAAGVTASVLEETHRGLGLHAWDFDNTQYTALSRAGWYQLVFYNTTLYSTKISILLLYLHIFAFHWVRVASKVVLVIVIVCSLWTIAITFTACIPLKAYWDYLLRPTAYCHGASLWWANTGLHMATDFLIFLLPMPVLGSLRLPRRQKCVLLALFAMGFFVWFVSILRLIIVIRTEQHPSYDYTYNDAVLTYWTLVEVNTAIACACFMTFKPLVGMWFPWLIDSAHSSLEDRDLYFAQGTGRPLTVGSKPSRGQLRVRTSYDSWLQQYPGKMSDVETVALEGRVGRPEKAARTSMGAVTDSPRTPTSRDSLGIRFAAAEETPTRGLNPPPLAHFQGEPSMRSGVVGDAAAHVTGPSLPLKLHSSTFNLLALTSERTEWGPDGTQSPGPR